MHIVLVAHGQFTFSPQERAALAQADRSIAADGGAEHVLTAGHVPHLVVGDLDSIGQATLTRLEGLGVPVERHPARKDATDLELALMAAQGATAITILGALGGRPDHAWANVLLLAACPCPARILHGSTSIHLLDARHPCLELATSPGDTVSLIPLADAHGVTLAGLEYPLQDATLPLGTPRGVSNVALGDAATITLTAGRLLVMHLPRGPRP